MLCATLARSRGDKQSNIKQSYKGVPAAASTPTRSTKTDEADRRGLGGVNYQTRSPSGRLGITELAYCPRVDSAGRVVYVHVVSPCLPFRLCALKNGAAGRRDEESRENVKHARYVHVIKTREECDRDML